MNVKTFETKSGQKPIDVFIKEQDIPTRKKIAFLINLLERDEAILLNIFKKKQNKVPRREIETAKARLASI